MAEKGRYVAKTNMQGIIIDDTTGEEVGIDMKARNVLLQDVDDLAQKASNYLNELYEIYELSNGQYGRARPKTAEQVAKEQSQINETILSAIQDIKADLKSLKADKEVIAI